MPLVTLSYILNVFTAHYVIPLVTLSYILNVLPPITSCSHTLVTLTLPVKLSHSLNVYPPITSCGDTLVTVTLPVKLSHSLNVYPPITSCGHTLVTLFVTQSHILNVSLPITSCGHTTRHHGRILNVLRVRSTIGDSRTTRSAPISCYGSCQTIHDFIGPRTQQLIGSDLVVRLSLTVDRGLCCPLRQLYYSSHYPSYCHTF